MFTYSKAFYDLKNALLALYDEGESTAAAHIILEHITDEDKLQRLTDKDKEFTTAQQEQYETIKEKLLRATPIQYVVGKAWFRGREFAVNENALIPRPETEELVDWIIADVRAAGTKPSILDIGAGSGCISVSLKLDIPETMVTACDVSVGAMLVARTNANVMGADISLQHIDFLQESQRALLGVYDIIVSNPPYIPDTQKDSIHANVLDHEPHVALFVSGGDPLLFYRLIADFGKKHLTERGIIYCELDYDYAVEARQLFEDKGYKNVEIRKDMSGNTRMLKAEKA